VWGALRSTFFIFISLIYASLSAANPAPIFNILLWLAIAYLIAKSLREIKSKKDQLAFSILIILLFSYITLGIKSTFFIAHFNEMYLGEASSLFPNNWMINSSKALIFPTIWFEKVMFAFSYEVQTFKIGSVEMSLGLLGTKILKISELMVLCFISVILNKKVINI
jgi:hypothetical protein